MNPSRAEPAKPDDGAAALNQPRQSTAVQARRQRRQRMLAALRHSERPRKPGLRACGLALCVLVVIGLLGQRSTPSVPARCSARPEATAIWDFCQTPRMSLPAAQLDHWQARSAELSEADFSAASLASADFAYARIRDSNLSLAVLKQARLTGADLRGTTFAHADLAGADFGFADLSSADLTGAVIDGANFSGAILNAAVWIDGRICGARSVGVCEPANSGTKPVEDDHVYLMEPSSSLHHFE